MLVLLQRPRRSFMDSSAREFAEVWMDRWLEIDPPGALRFLGSAAFLGRFPAMATTAGVSTFAREAGSAAFSKRSHGVSRSGRGIMSRRWRRARSARWEFYGQLPEDAQIVKASLFGENRAERGDLNDLGAWAQNFPSAAARANAVSAAMSASYRRDAARADTLLATTAPGPDRDAALRGLSEAMAPAAPADAATRALGIGDGTARRDALETVIVPWLKRAPETGRAWLQSAGGVPAAWKQEWLAAAGGAEK